MKHLLFFGAEAMIAFEEAVIGIPTEKAAGRGVALIAEYTHILWVHLDRRVICQWEGSFLLSSLIFNRRARERQTVMDIGLGRIEG